MPVGVPEAVCVFTTVTNPRALARGRSVKTRSPAVKEPLVPASTEIKVSRELSKATGMANPPSAAAVDPEPVIPVKSTYTSTSNVLLMAGVAGVSWMWTSALPENGPPWAATPAPSAARIVRVSINFFMVIPSTLINQKLVKTC